IERDDASGMTRQDRVQPCGRRVGLEFESETVLRIVRLGGERTSQLDEAVDDAPFRDLELVPRFPVPGLPQIGYDSREPARHAERVGLGLGNRPATDVLPAVIRAETIQTPL